MPAENGERGKQGIVVFFHGGGGGVSRVWELVAQPVLLPLSMRRLPAEL